MCFLFGIPDTVEDLKSTTEIIDKSVPIECTTPPEGMKQGNYDEIETIIEALENQDKTSRMYSSKLSLTNILQVIIS